MTTHNMSCRCRSFGKEGSFRVAVHVRMCSCFGLSCIKPPRTICSDLEQCFLHFSRVIWGLFTGPNTTSHSSSQRRCDWCGSRTFGSRQVKCKSKLQRFEVSVQGFVGAGCFGSESSWRRAVQRCKGSTTRWLHVSNTPRLSSRRL